MNALQKMAQLEKEICRDSAENPWTCSSRQTWEMGSLCSNRYSSQTRGMDMEHPYVERLNNPLLCRHNPELRSECPTLLPSAPCATRLKSQNMFLEMLM